MKILQVINSLNTGGAEKLIVETAPLIKNAGYEVDVLLLCDTNTEFKKKLTSKGINVWGLTKNIEAIYNPFLTLRLIPILNRYDLIHVHLFPSFYWVAFAKLLSIKVQYKLVKTEHCTINRRRKKNIFRIIEPYIYGCYDKLIGISTLSTNNLLSYLHCESEKIKTVNNGVNINAYFNAKPISREEFGLRSDDFILINVAGFRPAKDQDTIIKSLAQLPYRVKLLLVGDGERRAYCESLAKKLDVKDRVFFMGIRHDVPNLLKTADIVIMSSHYEGLSLSSIEGMSVNKPFIASDVQGLRDITYGAGLLFEKGNENELASHVIKLMENEEYYNQISASCLERAKEYDVHSMVDQLITTYEEVIKNK